MSLEDTLRKTKFLGFLKTQFLLQKSDIENALNAGYPVSIIWRTLHGQKKFEGQYDQFLSYVNTLIKKKPRKGTASKIKASINTLHMSPKGGSSSTESTSLKSETPLNLDANEDSYMLGGFKMNSKRPKSPPLNAPKPFDWNPVALTEEEIRTGKVTTR